MTAWLLIGFATGGFLAAIHTAFLFGVDGGTIGAIMVSSVLFYIGGSRILGGE